MSYLGRGLDNVSNVEKLDNITFNGGTTYALTKSSAAFFPAGSNNILISIDGVVQQGNFSVSGSNIVFTFSPTSSNTCDFIMHYGTGLITTPADSSVTEAKIGSNAVTKDKTNFVSTSSSPGLEIKGDNTTDGTLQLNCRVNSHGVKLKSPPHSAGQSYTLTLPSSAPSADKFIKTDGSGNLSFAEAGGGSWTLLETETTTSGATANFTSMSDDYHTFAFMFDTVRTVVDNDVIKLMVINGNGDSEQIFYAYERWAVNESGSTSSSNGGTYSTNPHNVNLFGSLGSGANEGCSGIMYFTGTRDSSDATLFWGNMVVFEHDNKYALYQMHGRISNSVLPDIRFYGGGGNWEHGKIRLYGIK
tara:strand:+ start:1 stop:1080 length:1080 start_codon:yes stop_codon:yes gene_type:complete